ncbi:MAG: hypothetical protein ABI461_01975 [Polyangiaceae bacterium]
MSGTALLVVEEAFVTRGSGVLVLPRITFDGSTHAPFAITLRFPNGEERAAQGVFEVSHIKGAFAPFAMLRVLDLKPEDVPAGTTISRNS